MFQDRLKVVIGDKSIRSFAKLIDRSEGTVRGFLQGREPKLADVISIANVSGYQFLWISTGQGCPKDTMDATNSDSSDITTSVEHKDPKDFRLLIRNYLVHNHDCSNDDLLSYISSMKTEFTEETMQDIMIYRILIGRSNRPY